MVKIRRCSWCGDDPLYVDYHDREWGVPVNDDRALFERLMLEGMQAGLSWYTVLKKRAHMREAFFAFDPEKIADHGEQALPGWLKDPGLIRHRGKLEALIDNAHACLALQRPLGALLWAFVDDAPKQNRWRSGAQVPAFTPVSIAMSKTLKKAGFRFVGPTICYAFMQSAGMVNDHQLHCFRYRDCQRMGQTWSG